MVLMGVEVHRFDDGALGIGEKRKPHRAENCDIERTNFDDLTQSAIAFLSSACGTPKQTLPEILPI
jgi:hypothetical protein